MLCEFCGLPVTPGEERGLNDGEDGAGHLACCEEERRRMNEAIQKDRIRQMRLDARRLLPWHLRDAVPPA